LCGERSDSGGRLKGDSGDTHPIVRITSFCSWSIISAPPAPAVLAPTPGGDNPDDSGDDGEDDDDEKEEEENNKEANDEQEENFVVIWPLTEHYTSILTWGTSLTCCKMFCML
jgi:hypothetical protein